MADVAFVRGGRPFNLDTGKIPLLPCPTNTDGKGKRFEGGRVLFPIRHLSRSLLPLSPVAVAQSSYLCSLALFVFPQPEEITYIHSFFSFFAPIFSDFFLSSISCTLGPQRAPTGPWRMGPTQVGLPSRCRPTTTRCSACSYYPSKNPRPC